MRRGEAVSGWWSSGWRLKICGVPSCTASIARAFSLPLSFSLSLLRIPRTLYISLYRSLSRDEAFVARSRCDAVRRLRETVTATRPHARIHCTHQEWECGLCLSRALARSPSLSPSLIDAAAGRGCGEWRRWKRGLSIRPVEIRSVCWPRDIWTDSVRLHCILSDLSRVLSRTRALSRIISRASCPPSFHPFALSPYPSRYQPEMAIYLTGLALRLAEQRGTQARVNNLRELVLQRLRHGDVRVKSCFRRRSRYVEIYSARTRLFESSVFEVVKSEPPPSVLDGGFFFFFHGLKLFSCAHSMREAAVYHLSR